jgi:UDP-GlcNAc:undecaprenyl-phosphate/decaprenyl-phosphate GlcNAc-1-phosphate transferase
MTFWLVMLTVASVALSATLAIVCKVLARRLGIVAHPKADRWHREAIPLLGGVALVLAVAIAMALSPVRAQTIWLVVAGAVALAFVGLIDDVWPLKPQAKLIAEVAVAAVAITLGLDLRLTGVPALDLVVTLFWIVGVTNAFNLLDNMDGLAAGIAAIAAGTQMTFLLMEGQTEVALLAGVVMGAALGFLLHNFNPASIFMGDAGSLFLGFLVAALSLVGHAPSSRGTASVLVFPVLVALVPIFDTAFVTVGRTLAGRPISQGGRDHTSHRLVASGLTERQAVILLYAVASMSALIAIYARAFGIGESVVAIVLFGIVVGVLGVYLGRGARDGTAATRNGRFFSRMVDSTMARQAMNVTIDALLIVLAYYAAYRLRFEQTFELEEGLFLQSLPIVLPCQMIGLAAFRAYQGVWRYTSLRDLLRIIQGVSLGTVLSVLAVLGLYRFQYYSRALFVLDWLLVIVFIGGSRLAFRTFAELLRPAAPNVKPVLIYGAGDGGVMLLREMRTNRDLARAPVGFLDDDRSKQRTQIQGTPVLGDVTMLEAILDHHEVAEVIISSSKIDPDNLDRLRALCRRRGIDVVRSVLRLE